MHIADVGVNPYIAIIFQPPIYSWYILGETERLNRDVGLYTFLVIA